MKKILHVSLMIFFLMIVTNTTSQANDVNTINACAKKKNGQLRIVSGPDDCLPSENYISWNSNVSEKIPISDLYVNESTGEDLPESGLSIDKPFKTISYAISVISNLARTYGKTITINVAAGNYHEALYISNDNITLIGEPGETTIDGPAGGAASIIIIENARGINITGFSIQNGQYWGILASYSYINCQNNILEYNKGGIRVRRNSYAKIENTTVRDNSGDGIELANVASGDINYCEIHNNGGSGVKVSRNSAAWVTSCSIYQNSLGVSALESNLSLEGNEIRNNSHGISVFSHSVCNVFGNNTIHNNTVDGINVFGNSRLRIDSVYGPDVIRNNSGDGISLQVDSSAGLGNGVSITDNVGWGLGCYDQAGDSKYGGQPAFSGNGQGDTNCDLF